MRYRVRGMAVPKNITAVIAIVGMQQVLARGAGIRQGTGSINTPFNSTHHFINQKPNSYGPLTDHQKDYIRDHYKTETVNKISRETGLTVGRVEAYCDLKGYNRPSTKTLMKLARPGRNEKISKISETVGTKKSLRPWGAGEYSNTTPFGIAKNIK